MSEHATPQRAGIEHPHDRNEQKVEKGQHVSFIWAGEELAGEVTKVETDDHGIHHAHVATTVKVPARNTTVIKKPTAAHKPEPKPAEESHRSSPQKPEHTRTHEGGKK
jgi:hypothetical protein